MSKIDDSATVTLLVNGTQAKKVLADIEAELDKAKKKVKDLQDEKASPKDIEKAKKDVEKLKRKYDECRSSIELVNDVMANLDKVSLKTLEKTLKSLNKQFKSAQQGSEAYEELAGKIRIVREQIAAVKDELKESKSLSDRFFGWATKIWATFEIGIKVVSAAVSKMREFVDAYAEMDQEMASVRKFTGMADAQVDELNEQFKKLDTRSSREQLNMLAQDAGRLGKQSVEDVMGFVRAADKINVALDDLGDGATLTLSKLTGVFGVEDQFGTEKSLLKVGSVINELSQNCAASAPYIANFTERVAGVGVQANMTIPQIMGFAAVLDSSSQKVEASATAVSQVLVHLYQDPAKYAKVAGLDVKDFTTLLKKDANEALILFLETLKKAGGMDVLSPMFKDMGENGSRAIAALSTLADKVEDVKAQQEAANIAFQEGISIDKEFAVQNNTVQASLDKCKNAAHEMQVEMGERLYPLVSHFLSSTSAVMRGLSVIVKFLFEHKATVVALTAAVLTYNLALKAMANWTNIVKTAKVAWLAVTRLSAAAVALLSGNVGRAKAAMVLLAGGVDKSRAAWVAFNTALKASVIGAVVAAISFLITSMVEASAKAKEFKKSMDEAMKSATSFSEETHKEIKSLDELFGKLEGAKKGTKEYKEAKDAIISKYGIYLQGLINEKGEINNLKEAYDRLTWAAKKSAEARGINSAKENLSSAFYQDIEKNTEKLRERLESMGMDDRQLTRIMTSISQYLGAGQNIPDDILNEIKDFEGTKGNWYDGLLKRVSPWGLANQLNSNLSDYRRRSDQLDKMDNRYFSTIESDELTKQITSLTKALDSQSPSDKIDISIPLKKEGSARRILSAFNDQEKDSNLQMSSDSFGAYIVNGTMSQSGAKALLYELLYEQQQRGIPQTNPNTNTLGEGSSYISQTLSDKERKAQEAAARREAAKAKKEFKEALDDIKGNRAEAETQAMADRSAGLIDYREYLERMRQAEVKYYEDASALYVKNDLAEDEDHKTLLKKKQEADDKYNRQRLALNKEAIERIAKIEEQELSAKYNAKQDKTIVDDLKYKEELLTIRFNKLVDLQSLYTKGSKEWEDHEHQIIDLLNQDTQEKRQAIIQKVAEFEKKFNKQSVADKYKLEYAALEELYKRKKITEEQYHDWLKKLKEEEAKALPGNADNTPQKNVNNAQKEFDKQKQELDKALASGQISQEDYDARLARIKDSLFDNIIAPLKDAKSEWLALMANMVDSWKDLASALNDPDGDPFNALANGIQATSALMGAVFSQMTAFMQAELQIQTSAVEKRYDKEISAAEGNTYRVAKLEKEKEAQIAKLKNDANRKMFAMQVIQAVAQTATNALNAYGSTVVIPVVGPTLAPIAAAVAAAQGAVQIALIKKQQQASETQGYSKGGFTKPGAVDEPAGIVHAGEWVASQRLLASPVARPMIEALDYAQRTNTIGSLRGEDVSRSITAPQTISRIADGNPSAAVMAASLESYAGVIDRLAQRLDEPFVTVATVSGDKGINKAQDEYTKLMNNKSPKSRRKNANNY